MTPSTVCLKLLVHQTKAKRALGNLHRLLYNLVARRAGALQNASTESIDSSQVWSRSSQGEENHAPPQPLARVQPTRTYPVTYQALIMISKLLTLIPYTRLVSLFAILLRRSGRHSTRLEPGPGEKPTELSPSPSKRKRRSGRNKKDYPRKKRLVIVHFERGRLPAYRLNISCSEASPGSRMEKTEMKSFT